MGKTISRESGGENGEKAQKLISAFFAFPESGSSKRLFSHRSFFSPEAIVGWRRVYDVHRGRGKKNKTQKEKNEIFFLVGKKIFLK